MCVKEIAFVLILGICISCNKSLDEEKDNGTSVNLKSTSTDLNFG